MAKPRLDDDDGSPQSSALFSLRMFVHTRHSWLATDAETARILREVGAHDACAAPLDAATSLPRLGVCLLATSRDAAELTRSLRCGPSGPDDAGVSDAGPSDAGPSDADPSDAGR